MPYSMPLWTILTKWPAPAGPTWPQPLSCGRRQGLEDGTQIVDRLLVAADHHAVTLFEAPDAAGGANVDELKAFGGDLLIVAHRVLVVGVAAVDENVAGIEQGFKLGDGLVHRLALRHHDPDGLAAGEVLGQVFERADADVAGFGEAGDRFGVEVEADHLVAAKPQPLRHVSAHLAQADQSQLHRSSSILGSAGAKALTNYVASAARLKSCPDTSCFSRRNVFGFVASLWQLVSCPQSSPHKYSVILSSVRRGGRSRRTCFSGPPFMP